MKQYIKDGKIYNLPITIQIQDKKIITNNAILLKQHGYQEYMYSQYMLSIEKLIENSNEYYNKICDEKILNDFVWKDNEFYLSLENQFNFKNLYDLRKLKEYPITIKSKKGFVLLENQQQLQDFYLSGVKFIEDCLMKCWENKKLAEQEIIKNHN